MATDVLTAGSLFSGIGGLDLGLERAGMAVRWQVENDAYCRRVLLKHWPDVARYGDIKELDPDDLEPVDLICGGFPCQPVSLAGNRRAQQDERWLWPEFARIVRHLRPRYVLMENVPGLLVHGMGDVLGDLATLGYDTEWQGIPAAAVGAPHLRWRIFVVAYADSQRHDGDDRVGDDRVSSSQGRQLRDDARGDAGAGSPASRTMADAGRSSGVSSGHAVQRDGASPDRRRGPTEPRRRGRAVPNALGNGGRSEIISGGTVGPFSIRSTGGPGRSDWWEIEPDVGRVAHGIPSRVDRLGALGNAVVPQVAEYVGRCIVEFDRERAA